MREKGSAVGAEHSGQLPVIVLAGRICAQKRPPCWRIFSGPARDQGLAFRALIIGDGELKAQLKDLLGRHRLADMVRMLDSVPHQKWLDILIASDIFLMPSQYEGISVALLEAMAAGVVPVVARVGGHGEIVPPDAGVLIPQGDNELEAYVDAIRRLLCDSAELRRMSERCKALAASTLSWEGMIDHFLAILDEAHRLRIDRPRHPISPGFGRELATLSLECKRLGDAVDWLWNTRTSSQTADTASLTTSPEAQAVARVAIRLSQTWVGRMMIHNKFLRVIGKRLMTRLARPE